MPEPATHSVPLFEGSASRRHQSKPYETLRAEAATYAAGAAGPDLAGVHTLVQFAGFPRSAHSLVGSLIDAHPDAVVAHELDVMGLVDEGLGRAEVFSLVCENSAEFERHGRYWNGFSYRLGGAAGGGSARPGVLGDKKADWAVRRVLRNPSLMARVGELLGEVRGAWVVVARNPFDNVATMSLRKGRAYDRIRIASSTPEDFRRNLREAQGSQVPDEVLPEMVADYASLCAGVARVRAGVPDGDWCELRHERLVAEPVATLQRLFRFLGLPVEPAFLDAAAGLVSPAENRSRHQLRWSAEARAGVERLAEEHPFLAGYGFDDG